MKGAQVGAGWALLALSVIGWPLSALTFAASEPPTVLGLSWFAITLTALDFLATSRVHRDQEEDGHGQDQRAVVRRLRRARVLQMPGARTRGHRAPRRRA